jgi:hypothetical protein
MAEQLYYAINNKLPEIRMKSKNPHIELDYVTIFENENSKATYSEE